MKPVAAIFLCLLLPIPCRADQQTAEAQKSLKDLGFYYGDVTGAKSQETNDAVRRYQIRSGLNITGDLNDETMQALKKSAAAEAAAASATVVPAAKAQPPTNDVQPSTEGTESRPDSSIRGPRDSEAPRQPFQAPPNPQFPPQPSGNVPPDGVYDGRAVPPSANNGTFAGTPYQIAPPEVQRRVIMDAQRTLTAIGLFKHPVDGNFGPDLEFSLRAYQARVHLHPSGRLDLETLAALELLPGPRHRFFPRRPLMPQGDQLPPVRGEWIRP